ncbi:DUF1573 domain-containing protein [Adhaeribacter arboris]|uniref:DUF1573 domain-containing protein n=1 Tax=Adhaeribacter arboris TaxID=2072846 RepID=A0A2T2YEK4_9BACT|nr:DUF1573 domain-containing protein [Adhaeribacter arboris]PSR53939.1 DUF1573 domain-containing protein [Adhaeribacter arboris]
MKVTKLYAGLLAVALLTASCDNLQNKTEGENATASAETSTPTEATVANPNLTNGTEISNADAPVMTFAEMEHDFGDIKPGSVVKHTFTFKNTGKSPLIISNASATCGCTVPEWPKEPVAPGAEGKIDVQFDSHGKSGQVSKTITIQANTQPSTNQIAIKTNILPDPAANGPLRAQ